MISSLLGIRVFDIEASSRCNLRCRFCPRDSLRDTGLMSEATFQRLLEMVAPRRTDSLTFVGIGEPLLNPALASFIRRAKAETRSRTWVTTNATLLTPTRAEELFSAGLDLLDVSFNGTDARTYEDLTGGARFEQTLAHIDGAVRLASQRGSTATVQINFILDRHNATREEAIKDFWRTRGIDRFRVQHLHNRGGALRTPGFQSVDQPGLHGRPCQVFQRFHFVSWRGDFLYCSHDLAREHVLATVGDHLADLARSRREVVARGHWPQFCEGCTETLRHSLDQRLDRLVWEEVRLALRPSRRQRAPRGEATP